MKILYLVTDLSSSHGWSTYAVNIIQEAQTQGHEVTALVQEKVRDILPGVTQYEVLTSPHAVAWNPITIFIRSCVLWFFLKKVKPDVVHIIVEPYVQLLYFLPVTNIKTILTIHGTYARVPLTVPEGVRRSLSAFVYSRVLRKIDSVIAVSKQTKKIFLDYTAWSDTSRVKVIHNSIGIKTELSAKAPRQYRDNFHIITIGAVKRRKGIHDTIRLFSEWTTLHAKKVTYHVVGPIDEASSYVKEVRQMAETYTSKYFTVIFHGLVTEEEKIEFLNKSDLYVHLERVLPSGGDVEGFGIGIIEAASYGVPALVAKGSATVEAVEEGKSGYCVDLEQESGVREAIDCLLIKKTISPETTHTWAESHAPNRIFEQIEVLYAMPKTDGSNTIKAL